MLPRILVITVTCALSACAFATRRDAGIAGCHVATPALTHSSTGELEQGDTAWAALRLSDKGGASLPLVRRQRSMSNGRWHYTADTLHILRLGWLGRLVITSAARF